MNLYIYKQMTIYDLKQAVFNDLENPMSFLTTKGFEDSTPTKIRNFGGFYFYNDNTEWFVTTPPAMVLKADVNTFKNGDHVLVLSIDDDLWESSIREKLVAALKLAHPQMEQSALPVDDIVKHCYFPKFKKLEIRSKYTAKRSKVLQYVNMYNKDTEITGGCNLSTGCKISCSIRFILSETKHENGHIDTGFRVDLGSGIRVHQMAGVPDAIKRPWDWSEVNFDNLAMPIYNSVRVKTPAMRVASVGVHSIQVDTKPEFKAAIDEFHKRAGVEAWDQQIMTSPNKPIASGDVAVATVVPNRNNQRIEWSVESIHTSRKKRRKT